MKRSDDGRYLLLKIEAKTAQDFKVLLRQALYEIEKELPPDPGASESQIQQNALLTLLSRQTLGDRKVEGHTTGSLGTYRFEFLHSSQEFYGLEQDLLEAGYVFDDSNDFYDDAPCYVHPSLPRKCITGQPLEIRDAPKRTSYI